MYDIFISFKNTDENGNPTEDFAIAKHLYDELTKMDFNVFFSAESLAELGVSNYEEGIDKALIEAKVMIVVLTKAEYAMPDSSPWVYNEWITFHKEILSKRKVGAQLYTCTQGVKLDDLPLRLRNVQNCDTKNNFAKLKQFLTSTLRRPIEKETPPAEPQQKEQKPTAKKSDAFISEEPIPTTPTLPPLSPTKNDQQVCFEAQYLDENKGIILKTLANFGVKNVKVVEATNGPTFASYYLDAPKNTAKKIAFLDNQIAIGSNCFKGLIVRNDYSRGYVCIDVPHKNRQLVTRKEMVTSPDFLVMKPSALPFPLGVDGAGKNVFFGIKKGTHFLISGAAGTGKSIFLHSLILSLMEKTSPENLRFILIDPKGIEMSPFEDAPHLLTGKIITNPGQALRALQWANEEMERRYELFKNMTLAGNYVVDLVGYNSALQNDAEKLPNIVIIIDEFADLMCIHKKGIESCIQRLTAKARAAGIHLILSTQRPSVDVITGAIKANLPTRICFRVTEEINSRIVLDTTGAEKLLGPGDMLYYTPGMRAPAHVQAPYVSPADLQNSLAHFRNTYPAVFDDTVAAYIQSDAAKPVATKKCDVETVYIEALRLVIQLGVATISHIQRKCSVGFNKAARILEWMEDMGYIAEFDGTAKPRKTLITKKQFEALYGPF